MFDLHAYQRRYYRENIEKIKSDNRAYHERLKLKWGVDSVSEAKKLQTEYIKIHPRKKSNPAEKAERIKEAKRRYVRKMELKWKMPIHRAIEAQRMERKRNEKS